MASEIEWLSTAEAAGRLGITPRTLYRFLDEGQLPGYRFGRVIRLQASDVDAFIEASRALSNHLSQAQASIETQLVQRGVSPDEARDTSSGFAGSLQPKISLLNQIREVEHHYGATLLCSDCHTMHRSMQHAWAGGALPGGPAAGGDWVGTGSSRCGTSSGQWSCVRFAWA